MTLNEQVVGVDPLADVALLRVKRIPKDIEPLEFADSNQLQVGEPVVAIGNPFGLASSVSSGIVSAIAREASSDWRVIKG
ncbi:MAG: hypothetical protein EBX69_11310, partial [Betaproteobacteria bacterium]|nr:hypothetical protein [Betaproteobacteria bacterium]